MSLGTHYKIDDFYLGLLLCPLFLKGKIPLPSSTVIYCFLILFPWQEASDFVNYIVNEAIL